MKHLSLQWRITLLTALLIACACVCMNLLLYRTGVTGMDALNGFMMQYQPGSADPLTIEIPQEEMSSLLAHFSQEVYDAKVVFGRKGWCITVVVTIVSAAIAYFVSGRALKPLQQLAQQAQQVDQDSIATTRLDENTVQEFGQLSRSVNRMLDGLAQSFELQRQFAGNAAHELRTPLAILQTKLELFAEEHPAMDAETAGLIRSLREQLDRLTALVRTLLEMSNLQSVSRTDQIALAPLVEEILTDLTPLAQKNNISLQQDCEELGMVGSDALIYRLVFNLVENGIKYNRPGGAVRVTLQQEKQTAVLRVADTGPGIPADCRESIFQPFFRVDKSRSREMGGVGLGLALVREIAVLHGGGVDRLRSERQHPRERQSRRAAVEEGHERGTREPAQSEFQWEYRRHDAGDGLHPHGASAGPGLHRCADGLGGGEQRARAGVRRPCGGEPLHRERQARDRVLSRRVRAERECDRLYDRESDGGVGL